MRLLSIRATRSLWLFHVGDLNPRGKSVTRDALSEMATRYSFAKIPDVKEITEARTKNQPFVFGGGIFKTKTGITTEISLTLYRDGILVDSTSSTSDGDEVLDDLLSWLHTDLGLIDYKTIQVTKVYVNEVFVSMSNSLNAINPKLDAFMQMIGTKLKSPVKKPTYQVGALGFWIDPEQNPKHVHFRIERAEERPFSENRYYSIAPLETEEHLKALQVLDDLMAK